MSLGNGYEHRIKDGINAKVESYDLVFDKITDADLAAINAFFDVTNGVDHFLWTPPMAGHNTQKKFIVKDQSDEPIEYNCNRLTCVFQQVFDP
jgi:phage-related protein